MKKKKKSKSKHFHPKLNGEKHPPKSKLPPNIECKTNFVSYKIAKMAGSHVDMLLCR